MKEKKQKKNKKGPEEKENHVQKPSKIPQVNEKPMNSIELLEKKLKKEDDKKKNYEAMSKV